MQALPEVGGWRQALSQAPRWWETQAMLGSPGSGSITLPGVWPVLLLLPGFISSPVEWNKAGCPAGHSAVSAWNTAYWGP